MSAAKEEAELGKRRRKMATLIRLVLLTAIALSGSACSTMSVLKASPAPDSGFLGSVSDNAVENEEFPFHRTYFPNDSKDELEKIQRIHVAEIKLDKLKNNSLYFRTEEAAKKAVAEDSEEIASLLRKSIVESLKENAGKRVIVVDEPTDDTLILELALVELTPTDVTRNVAGTALGAFVPGGGIVSFDSSGAIAVEGKLVDAKTGKVLFAFADREEGKLSLFSFNDFTLYGHARVVIADWSEQIGEIFSSAGKVQVVDSLGLTLSPI